MRPRQTARLAHTLASRPTQSGPRVPAVRASLAFLTLSALFAALLGAGTASAQKYPVQSGSLSVGVDTNGDGVIDDEDIVEPDPDAPEGEEPPAGVVEPGDDVRIAGGGFKPGSEVILTIESEPVTLGTTKADSKGEIDETVTLPEDFPLGDHTVKASGDSATGGRLVLELPVDVVPIGTASMADAESGGGGGIGPIKIVLGLVAAVGAGWYFFGSGKKSGSPVQKEATA